LSIFDMSLLLSENDRLRGALEGEAEDDKLED
jgi:hypothetical protein